MVLPVIKSVKIIHLEHNQLHYTETNFSKSKVSTLGCHAYECRLFSVYGAGLLQLGPPCKGNKLAEPNQHTWQCVFQLGAGQFMHDIQALLFDSSSLDYEQVVCLDCNSDPPKSQFFLAQAGSINLGPFSESLHLGGRTAPTVIACGPPEIFLADQPCLLCNVSKLKAMYRSCEKASKSSKQLILILDP